MRLRHFILIFILIAIIVIGYFGRWGLLWYIDPLPSCGSNKELFSISPIELENIKAIVPLGNIGPPSHTFPTNHLYFYIKKVNSGDRESPAIESPLLAPGDMWITRITTKEYLSENQVRVDYSLYFSPCREFQGYFHHVTSLSGKLNADMPKSGCTEYTTGGKRYKMCGKDVKIKVNAGEAIGTAGGRKGENALDFGASDMRTKELEYANKERWYKQILHLVCALDYYRQDVRNVLVDKLGDEATKRTIEPKCGEVEQDDPGTAQGVWFVKGTSDTYPEDRHLALVHDNIDPFRGVFSVGTSIKGLSSKTYYFTPSKTGLVNKDFNDVKADGNIYCYETFGMFNNFAQGFVILLQLIDEKTIRLEKQDSSKCTGFLGFSNGYTDFER